MGANRKPNKKHLVPAGWVVIESADEFEQILSLNADQEMPPGGILTWADHARPRVFFRSHKMAKDAILRTEHYRKAFGYKTLPEARFCRVQRIAEVMSPDKEVTT